MSNLRFGVVKCIGEMADFPLLSVQVKNLEIFLNSNKSNIFSHNLFSLLPFITRRIFKPTGN